jgi:hypothetical protein
MKGESGVETAKRIAGMLADYINETSIEAIPQYRGKASESGIADYLGIDRKRLKSSYCASLMVSLNELVEKFNTSSAPDEVDASPEIYPDSLIQTSDQAISKQLKAAERKVQRLEQELKASYEKINKLTGRISLLTLQLEDERHKRNGKSLHHRNSMRTIHVK